MPPERQVEALLLRSFGGHIDTLRMLARAAVVGFSLVTATLAVLIASNFSHDGDTIGVRSLQHHMFAIVQVLCDAEYSYASTAQVLSSFWLTHAV